MYRQESDYERCDLVSYVSSGGTVSSGRTTWIPQSHAHSDYGGGRRLAAFEIRISEVRSLVREVYS